MSGLKIVFLVLMLPAMFAACGKNGKKYVTHVDVEERIVADKIFIDVMATLDLGNTMLPTLSIPVKIAKKGEIGRIELGMDFVKISVSLSDLVQLQIENSVLPNGERLPLIAENQVVVIPLDKSGKFLLYVSLVGGAKAVGVTIPIKELDSLGAKHGTNVGIWPFTLGDFTIHGGFYTSPVAGENGLAIFTDLNPLFRILEAQGRWFELSDNTSVRLDYVTAPLNSKKEKEINKHLYKLHQNSTQLTVPLH